MKANTLHPSVSKGMHTTISPLLCASQNSKFKVIPFFLPTEH